MGLRASVGVEAAVVAEVVLTAIAPARSLDTVAVADLLEAPAARSWRPRSWRRRSWCATLPVAVVSSFTVVLANAEPASRVLHNPLRAARRVRCHQHARGGLLVLRHVLGHVASAVRVGGAERRTGLLRVRALALARSAAGVAQNGLDSRPAGLGAVAGADVIVYTDISAQPLLVGRSSISGGRKAQCCHHRRRRQRWAEHYASPSTSATAAHF